MCVCVCVMCYINQLPREDRTSGWQGSREEGKRQDAGEGLGLGAGDRGLPGP